MTKGSAIIKGKRLLLRPLLITDAKQMFENWASDSKVTKYLRWQAHTSIETVKVSLMKRQEKYQLSNYYDWGIVIQESNQLIGTVSVVNQDEAIKMMELGYALGQNWWGQGYMTEAIDLVVNYLLEQMDVNRLEARCDAENKNSGKVLLKSGFQFEGRLRQAAQNNRGLVDSCVYSLLKNDSRI